MKKLNCICNKLIHDFEDDIITVIFIIIFFGFPGILLLYGVHYESTVTHTTYIMKGTLIVLIGCFLWIIVDWFRRWMRNCRIYIRELKEWCRE